MCYCFLPSFVFLLSILDLSQREQLVSLHSEAAALRIELGSPILGAIKMAVQVLEAQGCVCGSSIQGSGFMLQCVGCHKQLHPACVGLHPSDPRISCAANAYLCAPCRRKGRTVQGSDAWTRDAPVTLKLPEGWLQTIDPSSGCIIFLERSHDGGVIQALRTPPPASVAVIPCAPNPCLARAPDTAALCQVCFEDLEELPDADAAASEQGELLVCLECGVRVHAGCYCGSTQRVGSTSGPTPFLCRPCEYAVNLRDAGCVLCGLAGGAMSPATCGGWAHVSCALWAPKGSGVEFEDVSAAKRTSAASTATESAAGGAAAASESALADSKVSPGSVRRNVQRVVVAESFKTVNGFLPKDSKNTNEGRRSSGGSSATGCCLCPNRKPGGVTVRCQEKNCKRVAHPVCGLEHGWYLFLDTSAHLEQAAQAAHEGAPADGNRKRRDKKGGKTKDTRAKEVERLVFCNEHAPQEDDDDDTLYCICQRLYFLFASFRASFCVSFGACSILLLIELLSVPLRDVDKTLTLLSNRYQEGEWMIECESCKGWFHGQCVGVLEKEADLLVDWRCPNCRPPPSEAAADMQLDMQVDMQVVTSRPAIVDGYAAPPETVATAPRAEEMSLLLNLAGGFP